MEFIDHEAIEESIKNQSLTFSDDDEVKNDEMEDFIDDTDQPREDVSFYRQFNPENLDHYHKFPNQVRDPRQASYRDNELYFGDEDTQPRPDNRNYVEFDKFSVLKNLSRNSRKS